MNSICDYHLIFLVLMLAVQLHASSQKILQIHENVTNDHASASKPVTCLCEQPLTEIFVLWKWSTLSCTLLDEFWWEKHNAELNPDVPNTADHKILKTNHKTLPYLGFPHSHSGQDRRCRTLLPCFFWAFAQLCHRKYKMKWNQGLKKVEHFCIYNKTNV